MNRGVLNRARYALNFAREFDEDNWSLYSEPIEEIDAELAKPCPDYELQVQVDSLIEDIRRADKHISEGDANAALIAIREAAVRTAPSYLHCISRTPTEKESPEPAKATAWTGKGCGVITDKQKQNMMENAHLGGEFAGAARLAERHDIPLGPLPLNQMELLTDAEIVQVIETEALKHGEAISVKAILGANDYLLMLDTFRAFEAAVLKKLGGTL